MLNATIHSTKDETYALTEDGLKFKVHTYDVDRLKLTSGNMIVGEQFYYRPKYLNEWDGRFEVGTIKIAEENEEIKKLRELGIEIE